MTSQLEDVFTALSLDDQALLVQAPDEEQRSILFRELLAGQAAPPLVDLSVAENVLLYPELRAAVFAALQPLPEQGIRYVTAYGSETLRTHMADRLGRSLGVTVPTSDLYAVSGVSAALECLALGLQRQDKPVPAGSQVLLPAPFWQGFYWCFGQQAGLTCLPVPLADTKEFRLTLADLRKAYQRSEPKPTLLVLTNPHNPLGVNYDQQLLESIYTWALTETKMHVISDEMYLHSQLSGGTTTFVSALALKATAKARDRVHVVWGFAKDFGLSGFRTGFLISRSPGVREVMTGDAVRRRTSQAWFSPYDSLKHFYTTQMLTAENGAFWDRLMRLYRERLTKQFTAVADVLKTSKIKYVHPAGANPAQFFWLDLRDFLRKPSDPEPGHMLFGDGRSSSPETALAHDILVHSGVKLLTGGTLSCPVPGYYRLCFTAVDQKTAVAAVTRMSAYLAGRRGS
jgi:aspartate/methionine/tyrosine aminotransferase